MISTNYSTIGYNNTYLKAKNEETTNPIPETQVNFKGKGAELVKGTKKAIVPLAATVAAYFGIKLAKKTTAPEHTEPSADNMNMNRNEYKAQKNVSDFYREYPPQNTDEYYETVSEKIAYNQSEIEYGKFLNDGAPKDMPEYIERNNNKIQSLEMENKQLISDTTDMILKDDKYKDVSEDTVSKLKENLEADSTWKGFKLNPETVDKELKYAKVCTGLGMNKSDVLAYTSDLGVDVKPQASVDEMINSIDNKTKQIETETATLNELIDKIQNGKCDFSGMSDEEIKTKIEEIQTAINEREKTRNWSTNANEGECGDRDNLEDLFS